MFSVTSKVRATNQKFCIVVTSSGQRSDLPKMSKLSSKFEELAIVSAKATITDDTMFDNYFRSLLSVSSLVVFAERQTGLNEIVYTQGESLGLLGTIIFCGLTL